MTVWQIEFCPEWSVEQVAFRRKKVVASSGLEKFENEGNLKEDYGTEPCHDWHCALAG